MTKGKRSHEECDRLCLVPLTEPVREVEEYAREEPRLGDPEHKPEYGHLQCIGGKCRHHHDDPPTDEDTGNPDMGTNPLGIRLLGSSKSRYPIKKIPDKKPKTSLVSPSALFISSAAKPKFTRSR
jgi:hypothetical protein